MERVYEKDGYLFIELTNRQDFDIKLVYTPLYFKALGIDDVEIIINQEGEEEEEDKEDKEEEDEEQPESKETVDVNTEPIVEEVGEVIKKENGEQPLEDKKIGEATDADKNEAIKEPLNVAPSEVKSVETNAPPLPPPPPPLKNIENPDKKVQSGGASQNYDETSTAKITVPYRYFVYFLRSPSYIKSTAPNLSSDWFSKFNFNMFRKQPSSSENETADQSLPVEPQDDENKQEINSEQVGNVIIKIKKEGQNNIETLTAYLERKKGDKRTIFTYEDTGLTWALKKRITDDIDRQIEFMHKHDLDFSEVNPGKIYYLNDHFVILDANSIIKRDDIDRNPYEKFGI